jgi:hypothetical protein
VRVRTFAFVCVLLVPALAVAGHEFPVPPGLATPATAAGMLTVWPYTAADFTDPGAPVASDPVNLIILNTDPRAVRQALMSLAGARAGFPAVAPFNCLWFDGMGNEQAAYGEPEGWVGGALQLTCYLPGGNPLGNPFRYHVRLFRIGEHTLVGAHFEINIPGTAEHETLSWNAARDFVLYDLRRAGASVSTIPAARLFTPATGSFGLVRRQVYDGLVGDPKVPNPAWAILQYAGLPVPPAVPAPGDVPIPADGVAYLVAGGLVHHPARYDVTTTIPSVQYSVDAPKPFCNAGGEFVHLTGSLEFALRVQTNPSGKYQRTYTLGGTLQVRMLSGPDAGKVYSAVISERHRAMLTDEYQEVTEIGTQMLLRNPPQVLGWVLGVGQQDGYLKQTVCGF